METELTQITKYLLSQSWHVAVLVLVVAIVSALLKNRSAHVRYLLWLIVLAKCLAPPLLTIPLAILPREKPAPPPLAIPLRMPIVNFDAAENEAIFALPTAVPEPSLIDRLARVTASQWLAIGWIAGLSVLLLLASVKALRTNRWLGRERKRPAARLRADIENLFAALGIKNAPAVWLVDGIGQPFVWGLPRGAIYLPANFAQISNPEHRRSVLMHELSHVLRLDASINLMQIIAQAIFWFHPFVWWANKKLRQEREKCCDEMAIARLEALPKDYGSAIVNTLIAERRSNVPVPSLAVAGPARNIEDRIKTIMNPGRKFYRRPGIVALVSVVLLAAVAVPTTLALTSRRAEAPGENAPIAREDSADNAESNPRRVVSYSDSAEPSLHAEDSRPQILFDCRIYEVSADVQVAPDQEPAEDRTPVSVHTGKQYADRLAKLARTESGASKLLAEPRVLILDGEEATISVESQTVCITGYLEPDQPGQEPTPITKTLLGGIKLKLTGKILQSKVTGETVQSNRIKLDIDFTRSQPAVKTRRDSKGRKIQIPLRTTNTLVSEVMVNDAQPVIIAAGESLKETGRRVALVITPSIISTTETKTDVAAVRDTAQGGSMLRHAFEPQYISRTELRESLRRWVGRLPKDTPIAVVTEVAGQVMVYGSPEAVEMAKAFVAEVDVRPSTKVSRIFEPKHADCKKLAQDLSRLLNALYGDSPGQRPRIESLTIVPDGRTNKLIVQATAADLQKLETLIEALDVPDDGGESSYKPVGPVKTLYRIYKLEHADAGELAQTLTCLAPVIADAPDGTSQTADAAGSVSLMQITALPEANRLLVAAPEHEFAELEKLIRALDVPDERTSSAEHVEPVDELITEIEQIARRGDAGPAEAAKGAPKVAFEPGRLNILLKDDKTEPPEVKITGLDGRPFSITAVEATGDSITAEIDPSRQATEFVLKPDIDPSRLRRGMSGVIDIGLSHPQCKRISIPFDVLPEFKINPPVIIVWDAEPGKTVSRDMWLLNNYGEDFSIESVSSSNDTVKVQAWQKIGNGYKMRLGITPPPEEGRLRFTDEMFVGTSVGDNDLRISCRGFYARGARPATVKEAPKSVVKKAEDDAGNAARLETLKAERDMLAREMDMLGQRIAELRETSGSTALREGQEAALAGLSRLLKKLTETESRRIRLQSTVALLEKAQEPVDPEQLLAMRQQHINTDPTVKALSDRIAQLRVELLGLSQTYSKNHPEHQRKAELLDSLVARLDQARDNLAKAVDDLISEQASDARKQQLKELRAELEQSVKEERVLRDLLVQMDQQVITLGQQQLQLLRQKLDLATQKHEELCLRIEEIEKNRKKRRVPSVDW